MLNKDYTSGIQNAIRNSLSLDFSPVQNKLDQLPDIVSTGITDWDKAMRKQAYENALKSGNQEQIDKALADYNPEAYANVLTGREQRQQALEDAQAERDFKRELIDLQTQRAFALENMRNQNARSLAEFKAGLSGGGAVAPTEVNGYTLTGNKAYDDAYLKQQGKKDAETAIAMRDAADMEPALKQSMIQGYKAVSTGTGTGPIGGRLADWGLNPIPGAGSNFADVSTANNQMNAFLRKQLAATGLTGQELNSAVEAEVYRYNISPRDSEAVVKRKMENFAKDKLGGADFLGIPQTPDYYKNKYGF